MRDLNTWRKAHSWFKLDFQARNSTNKKSPFLPVEVVNAGALSLSADWYKKEALQSFVGLDGDCKADVLLPTGHGGMVHFQENNKKTQQIGRRDDKKSLTKYPVQLSDTLSKEKFTLFDLK